MNSKKYIKRPLKMYVIVQKVLKHFLVFPTIKLLIFIPSSFQQFSEQKFKIVHKYFKMLQNISKELKSKFFELFL